MTDTERLDKLEEFLVASADDCISIMTSCSGRMLSICALADEISANWDELGSGGTIRDAIDNLAIKGE
jgi:hypothetical protein